MPSWNQCGLSEWLGTLRMSEPFSAGVCVLPMGEAHLYITSITITADPTPKSKALNRALCRHKKINLYNFTLIKHDSSVTKDHY